MIGANAFVLAKRVPVLRRFFFGRIHEKFNAERLPRIIHMFWDSGFETAPEICRVCIQSWVDQNPRWEVRVISSVEADLVVQRKLLPTGVRTAHYADILRTKLLHDVGGVWADATVLCLQPLDDWLLPMFNQCDFFAFSRPGQDRVLSNWFMASLPQGSIINAYWKLTARFWRNRQRPSPNYFWHHSLFEYLVRTSLHFRRMWNSVPKISAEPVHVLKHGVRRGGLLPEDIQRIAHTPLQKLSYKDGITMDHVDAALSARENLKFAVRLDGQIR